MRGAVLELAALLIAAAVVGFGANRLRSDPLPASLPAAYYAIESQAQAISTQHARRLFEEGHAVFIDARGRDSYEAERIQGACNVPFEQWRELYEELLPWIENQPVVIYASPEEISLADDLAGALRDRGQTGPLYVYFGDIDAWRAAGLPIGSGPDPILSTPADEDGF